MITIKWFSGQVVLSRVIAHDPKKSSYIFFSSYVDYLKARALTPGLEDVTGEDDPEEVFRLTVIVAGGRTYKDFSKVWDVLDELKPSLIVHGGCTGADSHADCFADLNGIQKHVVPYMSELGKAGGPARNKKMIQIHNHVGKNRATVLVAFPGGDGTANCISEARKVGMRIIEVTRGLICHK